MLAANPNQWWVYQARGLAQMQLGHADTAETEFGKAIQFAMAAKDFDAVDSAVATMARQVGPAKALAVLEPHQNENVRYTLIAASLNQQLHHDRQASALIESAMGQVDSAKPADQTRILGLAGAIYTQLTPPQTDKARAAYERLVKLQPNNAQALNELAWLLAVETKPPQPAAALPYSTRAYALASSASTFNPSIGDTQGWVLVLNGKVDEGAAILQKVVDAAPSVDNRYHLGEALIRQGKFDLAKTQLDAAKQLIDAAIQGKATVDPALKSAVDAASAVADAKSH
jgi:Flp pilus assembly protein TadD